MRYMDYLKQAHHTQDTQCPFCNMDTQHILEYNETCIVFVARSPYAPDHIILVPRRHVILLEELTAQEYTDITSLVFERNKRLHTKYQEVNILIRDGIKGGIAGKTIDHLHYHLIPNCLIMAEGMTLDKRIFYSDEEYQNITESIRTGFLT